MGYSRAVTNGVLGRFYDTSPIHPQTKNHLAGTSVAKQQKALRHGLSSILKLVEDDRTVDHGRHCAWIQLGLSSGFFQDRWS